MKLLELLYNSENRYIDEIDRLEKNPDEVSFVDAGDGSGFVCLEASDGSFDWNIARHVGDWQTAKDFIGSIPFKDFVLLVDEGVDLSRYPDFKSEGSLIYFENFASANFDYDEEEAKSYLNCSEIGLPKNSIKTKASALNSRIDDLYLVMKNGICGYIKVIKSCWHYAEVAIEINAEYRGQGFGGALLGMMVQQFASKGLKMSYVVEESNVPSVKIAEKYLRQAFILDKYVVSCKPERRAIEQRA